jgi:LacI family transcriptional regulator
MVAVGAIQVCQEHGKKIPEDIAIVGVDGAAIGTIINPKLTTLKIELTEVGKLIMQTLLNNINNENMATSVLLRPELVIRESA